MNKYRKTNDFFKDVDNFDLVEDDYEPKLTKGYSHKFNVDWFVEHFDGQENKLKALHRYLTMKTCLYAESFKNIKDIDVKFYPIEDKKINILCRVTYEGEPPNFKFKPIGDCLRAYKKSVLKHKEEMEKIQAKRGPKKSKSKKKRLKTVVEEPVEVEAEKEVEEAEVEEEVETEVEEEVEKEVEEEVEEEVKREVEEENEQDDEDDEDDEEHLNNLQRIRKIVEKSLRNENEKPTLHLNSPISEPEEEDDDDEDFSFDDLISEAREEAGSQKSLSDEDYVHLGFHNVGLMIIGSIFFGVGAYRLL